MAATDAGHLNEAVAESGRTALEDIPLPALRDDVRVQPGPRDHAGRPTWTLFDPLRNKFFQLDERAFQLVCCWHEGTARSIAATVAARFPWQPSVEDVSEFFEFLVQSELLVVRDGFLRARLLRSDRMRTQTVFQQLLHNYLFFRVPLLRPDRLLDRVFPRVQFLLTKQFLLFSAMVGLVSLALLLRQWQTFVGGFDWFFSLEGAIVFALTLASVKILHEMGHALACRKYGVRVASMGVSFIVMWPVLYTDATDGWRLTSRHQRAMISSAGVITELVLACYALAFWLLLPDGLPRSVAFTVATTTLVMSLLVNLNPMMRFDGYFFLSDILNMPNLQERSFALARWQLRGWLFGDIGAPPERMERRLHLMLLTYAYSVWIYRFFLFIGIALLVYHMFFKALGIFLFLVEIWFFIVKPIRNEMLHWPNLWRSMGEVRRRRWYWLGGVVLLILLFPWRQDFISQAMLVDTRYERLFPVRASMVEEVLVTQGEPVQAGQVLARLNSPELDKQYRVTMLDVQRLRSQLDRSLTDRELASGRLVLQQALQRSETELAALARVRDQLVISAPVAGRVEDLMQDLHPGRWVSPEQQLMTVRAGAGLHVTALVPESKLGALQEGSEARFFGEASGAPAGLDLRVTGVERSAVVALDSPYFAVPFGGEIPAGHRDGGRDLVPDISVYRVHLEPSASLAAEEMPAQRLRGWVHFEGERKTLLGRLFRLVIGTLVREAGF